MRLRQLAQNLTNVLLMGITFSASGCNIVTTPSTEMPYLERAEALFENPRDELLPPVIFHVQPPPGSVVSLSSPEDWWLYHVYGQPSRLCVELRQVQLIQGGRASWETELLLDHELVETRREYQTDLADGEHDLVCWKGILSVGLHVADLRMKSALSEEFTYSWAFEIVE